MSPAITPVRVATALATGLVTTAYYATPDVIRSRTARGWAKAGLAAVAVAASVPEFRASRAAARQAEAAPEHPAPDAGTAGWGPDGAAPAGAEPADDEAGPRLSLADVSTRGKAAAAGAVALVLAASVASLVLGERWVFRHGERRAAAGKPLPHTGPALVYGAVGAALAMLPDPSTTAAAGDRA